MILHENCIKTVPPSGSFHIGKYCPLDGIFCFALIHHLVIGRNIPMEEFIGWVCSLAQRGLIEFIPKTDPMVQGLLRYREDIFHDYNRQNFEQLLKNECTYVTGHTIRSTKRVIYEYAR